LYIFDEPSSYLDIKQRIKVSKFIKSLADEKTAIIVVEHDLIILDYMADLINIMYGEKGAYGIVSQPKATKTGINVFLDGQLKDENVRFRSSQIRFTVRPVSKERIKPELVSWKDIKKKLGKFDLAADEGSIKKNDVCGVLGENGIGKTTFVKILAGVLEEDKGIIDRKLRVSYKPQYLESDSDELVASFVNDAFQKYDVQLVRPLELKDLMTKKLNELSGGELQKVAIAHCLSQDADLYLLDEPSAYLDVEQRLLISKVIRDFIEQKNASCLVVDHDILFIDYLSDELIVFDGKPAKHGNVKGPFSMGEGMNMFLGDLDITMRRDQESHRPRINKPDSQIDRKQKSEKKLYYA
jgi:ATP-binding cassette subfamily E protein 1